MESDLGLRGSKLKELLDMEREAEIEEFDQLFKTLSRRDLEQRGLCISNLSMGEITAGLYGKVLIPFEYINYKQHKKVDEQTHKLSNGDIVTVTDANTRPSSTSELRGIVYRVTEKAVIVSFNEFDDALNELSEPLTLCLLPNDITYLRCKQAVKKLTEYVESDSLENVRNILCGYSEPSKELNEFPEELARKVEDNWFNENLNSIQKEAVIHSLKSKELAIIHGPPGTGKTTTLVEFIKKACMDLNAKVLCCAPSNIAVDNIAEKLIQGEGSLKVVRIGHPARLLDSVQNRCLDALVQRADATEVVMDSKKELKSVLNKLSKQGNKEEKAALREERKRLRGDIREFEKKAVKEIFTGAQVILSTTTMAGGNKLFNFCSNLPGKVLDIVVIDECAQATEPSCWIPIQYAKKVVFAGDHKQLEPTIKSMEAAKEGLSNTLFEQMINKYPEASKMLTIQYRMNEKIMKWSSEAMYGNELVAAPEVADHLLSDNEELKLPENPDCDTEELKTFLENPLYLIDTSYCKMYESVEEDSGSKSNIGEGSLIKVMVERLKLLGLNDSQIGVITPYNAQANLIRKALREEPSKNKKSFCEVSTVDGFQGREKDVIIISMVRSNLHGEVGFLRNERRMNVAVTRARKLCILIGDTDCVSKSMVAASKETTLDNDVKVPEEISTFYDNKISFLGNLCEYFKKYGEYVSANEFRDDDRVLFDVGEAEKTNIKEEIKAETEEKQDEASNKSKKKRKRNKKKNKGNNQEEEKKVSKVAIEQQNTTTPLEPLSKPTKSDYKNARAPKVAEKQQKPAPKTEPEIDFEEEKAAKRREKNKKKRQKQKQKKKEAEQQEKEKLDKMDEDEYLDFLIDTNHKCQFKEGGKQCKKQNALYLRECLMCHSKYCFPHLQPEVHDCKGLQ
ncbi:unnamed protein product [Moneuplotes crassus]|uniref:DNA helicase n=1 Tax=Euplotes crassus TaxID=5936 RepID=A0AAD2D5V4_EUPCR|nr:unnamed protein product [Moneuplotes crassus]